MKSRFYIYELGMVFHSCKFSTWEVRQENLEFKGILSHIASLRSAWATWHETLPQKKTKNSYFYRRNTWECLGHFFTLKQRWGRKAVRDTGGPLSCPSGILLCHLLVTGPVLVLCPDLILELPACSQDPPAGKLLTFLFSLRSRFLFCFVFPVKLLNHCKPCLFCTKESKTLQCNK